MMIFSMLSYLLKDTNIKFEDAGMAELVYSIPVNETETFNILLMHGHQKDMSGDLDKAIMKIKGLYSAKGVRIDFVLFGHFYEARITDSYARSSSMVGANAYADKGLHLYSKASQNLHIVWNRNDVMSVKVDLQQSNPDIYYQYDKSFESYTERSGDKLSKETIPVSSYIIPVAH